GRSYFDNKPTARPPHEILEAQSAAEAAPPTPEKREVFSPLEPLEVAPAAVPAAKPVEAAAKPAESSAVVKLKPVERKAEGETPAPPVSDQQRRSDAAIAAEKVRRQVDTQTYQYPSVDLLDKGKGVSNADANAELQQTRELLDDTIQSFGIDARIINVTRGPSVTRFELELMRGVKLNKLTGISDDIALALGAASVRIAPITGRNSVVGIEIPNQLVTPVPIREVIDSKEFRTHVSKVAFAVGKDISGKNVVGNIAKLPHMLIAGTTGSGKSVCTNSLIISLLYKSSPEDVRLIMVDPKMVELGIYNGIPHLLIPVVTDPKKAAGALQWAVTEMMKRYRAFSELGVRDLASYNAHMLQNGEEKLPQIVVVIDELADLMLVAAKEVEESICRVAQMGRAAGMHLVIATQRPSSDVITGLMKANIPSRIAFAVASSLESRIILDSVGAEKLVGKGDMLYAPLGIGKPQRVQGCMISDEEVARVVEFIKQNSVENYDDSVMEEVESSAQSVGTKNGKGASAQSESAGNKASTEDSASEMDELLPQAVEVVVETGMASVSMLQRRLKLGYSRAARLVDQMEERKIVGPFEGSKPRQVLVTKEQWAAQKEQFLGSGAPQESVIQADEFAAALAMSEAADAAEAAGDALDIGEEPPF
ncbi:MAG: DNA translocase FtsK, partial [Oscillospiraceae bacterium]|nr:DNA translocase FtsK [Oscillospiraceae bacterium]